MRTQAVLDPRILRTGFHARNPRKQPGASDVVLDRAATVALGDDLFEAIPVSKLPATPSPRSTYLLLNDTDRKISIHNLARFPAKLHTPLVTWAIGRYSKPGDVVLDPFCGCGTVLLEATLRGRRAVGRDVDPYSALIAAAKCSPPSVNEYQKAVAELSTALAGLARTDQQYTALAKSDISQKEFEVAAADLDLPPIPNIQHWFKRYILVDLGRIWKRLRDVRGTAALERYLQVSFASLLRLCSNADPDTISGLEVTRRMRERLAAGRYLNPFAMLRNRLERNGAGLLESYWKRRKALLSFHQPAVGTQSALLRKSFRGYQSRVSLILTSPPYCSAVEYYRRHTLEHYWLGFMQHEGEGAKLRSQYVGRRNYVYDDAELLLTKLPPVIALDLGSRFTGETHERRRRLRAIIKYFVDMAYWLDNAAEMLVPGGHLVLVIGDSTVHGEPIATGAFMQMLAPFDLEPLKDFSYLLRNRSMQYSRWNQADVAVENVIVFRKRRP